MSTDTSRSRWQTVPTLIVLGVGLLVVFAVWLLSCIWSFAEQTRAARALGFEHPHVLPWMLDALAAALALVALAAALAGQSAGLARLGVAAALAGSVWANAAGVSLRSGGHPQHDAVAMAAIAPVSAFVALEVLLGKIRRLVLWLRGEEPPPAIPHLRLIRLALSPSTFKAWRKQVIDLTDPSKLAVGHPSATAPGAASSARNVGGATEPGAGPTPVPGSALNGTAPDDSGAALTPAGPADPTPGGPAGLDQTMTRSTGSTSSGGSTPVDHRVMDQSTDWTGGPVDQDHPVDQGHGSVGQARSTGSPDGPGHDLPDLTRLSEPADRVTAIVDHRLTGWTIPELARVFAVSPSTAKRDRAAARKAASPLRIAR